MAEAVRGFRSAQWPPRIRQAQWKVRDEDAYRRPFNRRTAAPVLFVGNYYDPATNYDAAVSATKLLPGQPADLQRQLGAHRIPQFGLPDRRGRRLPDRRHPAGPRPDLRR